MARKFLHLVSLSILCAVLAAAQPLNRTAATSLRLQIPADNTRFSIERAFPTLSFSRPVAAVSPPGDNRRLFVVEKTGRIYLIPDVTAANPTRTLFLDLTSRVAAFPDLNDERGLLALAFHPSYATNGQFYVWYTLNTTSSVGGGLHDRLSRFRVSSDPNIADADSEQPLLTQRDEAENHNGGELLFGPDGYLYLSIGDEGAANDLFQNSQRIDRDFFSGILRLDVDQRPGSLPPNAHPAVHAGTYAVPPDNPFVGATTFNGSAVNAAAVRTEFWAVGLRNPWRMSFDSATGMLWCADVGQNIREEINVISRGGNYGWSYREGSIPGPRSDPPAGINFVPPVWDYGRPDGASVIGGLVYRGTRYPALQGQYLFGDFVSGRIWSLLPDGANPVGPDRIQLLGTTNTPSSFGLDPATGEVLITNLASGTVSRLVAMVETAAPEVPATLSATGAFSDVATLTPAPGIIAYEPNASFWSDHARKRRWFALPDLASRFGFSAAGAWTLPTGAVWIKHFDLELTRGDPASARRIETRFLIKTATGVSGLTYRWNDAQTDATLVPDEGEEQTFTVNENGALRPQTWRFPSRSECLACHTAAGGYALGFNTRQLNREHAFPGGQANIIAALAQTGYLDTDAPPVPATLPALVSPEDATKPLELRARSYLDVNCAQCHQPGGPALGSWDARATTALSAANLLNGALLDHGGDLANRVLVPGDAAHSRILQRMAIRGPGQMPPVGSNERDLAGETLLAQWIAQLAAPLPTAAGSPLLNFGVRAQVGSGAQVLIPSFVIGPGAGKTVLIRAIGPTLSNFEIPAGDALAAPVLTLFSGTQPIAANTRWNTNANAAEVRAAALRSGAFALPETSADSALLVALAPGAYTAQAASLTNTPGLALVEVYDADSAPSATGSRLINTAVRAQVGVGANILIPGLVVGEGGARNLLIRAVGPGLAAHGLANFLAEPVLSLFSGQQSIASNAGWNTAANAALIRETAARVGAFVLAEGSSDSALLLTLLPGAYTIHVSGRGATSGIALVEIYEAP